MKEAGRSLKKTVTLTHSVLEKKRVLGTCDLKL